MTQEKVSSLLIKYKDVIPSDRVAYLKNALKKSGPKCLRNNLFL